MELEAFYVHFRDQNFIHGNGYELGVKQVAVAYQDQRSDSFSAQMTQDQLQLLKTQMKLETKAIQNNWMVPGHVDLQVNYSWNFKEHGGGKAGGGHKQKVIKNCIVNSFRGFSFFKI